VSFNLNVTKRGAGITTLTVLTFGYLLSDFSSVYWQRRSHFENVTPAGTVGVSVPLEGKDS
jgi:hypothetical protein